MDHPKDILRKLAREHAPSPTIEPATPFQQPGMQAIFYEGLPFDGRKTKVFAWLGVPESARQKPVPAMVLVHGGGGSAFADWVRLWMSRGYAAIAMDLNGCVPTGEYDQWPAHDHPGPVGNLSRAQAWPFKGIDVPVEDQWPFHAVADVLLAHTILRHTPGVDKDRIGITGISWGGWTTCLAASIDRRFKIAVPVYGCGFIHEDSIWKHEGRFNELGPDRAARWANLWDPSGWLPENRHPILWINGTNDFAYPMSSWQKSYRIPQTPRTVVCPVRMPHGHNGPGENPEEIHAFANHHLNNGPTLAKFVSSGSSGHGAWATFESERPIVRAEINFTTDTHWWPERTWHTANAHWSDHNAAAHAAVPDKAHVYYFNVYDDRGLIVSSEHVNTEG